MAKDSGMLPSLSRWAWTDKAKILPVRYELICYSEGKFEPPYDALDKRPAVTPRRLLAHWTDPRMVWGDTQELYNHRSGAVRDLLGGMWCGGVNPDEKYIRRGFESLVEMLLGKPSCHRTISFAYGSSGKISNFRAVKQVAIPNENNSPYLDIDGVAPVMDVPPRELDFGFAASPRRVKRFFRLVHPYIPNSVKLRLCMTEHRRMFRFRGDRRLGLWTRRYYLEMPHVHRTSWRMSPAPVIRNDVNLDGIAPLPIAVVGRIFPGGTVHELIAMLWPFSGHAVCLIATELPIELYLHINELPREMLRQAGIIEEAQSSAEGRLSC